LLIGIVFDVKADPDPNFPVDADLDADPDPDRHQHDPSTHADPFFLSFFYFTATTA
jgi:hypothetical protein